MTRRLHTVLLAIATSCYGSCKQNNEVFAGLSAFIVPGCKYFLNLQYLNTVYMVNTRMVPCIFVYFLIIFNYSQLVVVCTNNGL